MASIDDTLRNCSYGIFASIFFYFVNDFYKNICKKVDLYNDMYPRLYEVWLKTYQLVLALNNWKLDKTLSNDVLLSSIITNICGGVKEEASQNNIRIIRTDLFRILNLLWSDVIKDKEKFLEVYGHIIEREEYSNLNDKELDISIEKLQEHIPSNGQISKTTPITMTDHEIERTIYLVLKFKSDLASMVNKYSMYYYGNQRGVRKDAI